MKQYKTVEEKVVVKKKCVLFKCDMCGREAEHPEAEYFVWGGVGGAGGKLSMWKECDGDYDKDEIELCIECAKWLLYGITRTHDLKRPADWHWP